MRKRIENRVNVYPLTIGLLALTIAIGADDAWQFWPAVALVVIAWGSLARDLIRRA